MPRKGFRYRVISNEDINVVSYICKSAIQFLNNFHVIFSALTMPGMSRQTSIVLSLVGSSVYREEPRIQSWTDLGRFSSSFTYSCVNLVKFLEPSLHFPVFKMEIILPTNQVEYLWVCIIKYLLQMTCKVVHFYGLHLMIPHLTDKETEAKSG